MFCFLLPRGWHHFPLPLASTHLCQSASEQWHPHETDPDMVRPQHFFNHRRYLCPPGFLGPGAIRGGDERDVPAQGGIHSIKKLRRKIAAVPMAETEGFEPPDGLTRQLISSQPRYDHFDTSPCCISNALPVHRSERVSRRKRRKNVENP